MNSLLHPPQFHLARQDVNHLQLHADSGAVIDIFVLEQDIVRVRVLPDGLAHGPRSWAVAPGQEDVALEGRDRLDLNGYSLPSFSLLQDATMLCVQTAEVRLQIALKGGRCSWALWRDGVWHTVLEDRATQAYNFGWWDQRIYHYKARRNDEIYLGLGERAGALNRAGGSYRMVNIDAMGYSARTTDPLYKHIPFYLTWQPQAALGFGLFYDTLADCSFDMGRELDNYHGAYRHFIADHGDLDYYFIASAHTPLDAVKRFTWLTGTPAWMPKSGLGYSGSTMSYTDAPDAQQRMNGFLDKCREHDILCDSFHLSSGYTSIGAKRYVFNWNHDKFPDIKAFTQRYADHGVALCANIKPCLLQDHPAFAEVMRAQLLIATADGAPAWVQFWDEVGAYLDFTNPATIDWWKSQVKRALLDYGIAATWNDNNEFEIWDTRAIAHGFGTPFPAHQAKVLHTMLMMRASRDAQREHAPQLRPFLVSRSGSVGMHRYVQTWSGDNSTSWETLRYNIKMALGLALSGISNIGHDIGGFAGPAPDPELLVRWVAHGAFLPRFSIHSWNDDGTVNEPWMYPSVTGQISALIKLRYRFIPYLYHQLWQWHCSYEPVLRPTFTEFPYDPRCFEEGDDLMIGDALLLASVVEAGQTERRVYLPEGARWITYWSGQRFDGGTTVSLPAPWDQPVLLIREGSVVPLNVADQHFAAPADQRGFLITPPQGTAEIEGRCVEDDGVSEAWRDGMTAYWRVLVSGDTSRLRLQITHSGPLPATLDAAQVQIFLPADETRAIEIVAGQLLASETEAGWQRLSIGLS